jgi:pyruvate dehydrogenase E1 component alpha subunit
MTVAATFEIRFTRYLLPDGREACDLPSFAADPHALVPNYRAMVFMRALDAKAVAMQRTGQIGTYASTLGKEAIDAGIGAVLAPNDVLLPSYRESGILMLRGVSPHRTLLYWGGDERGNVFPESPHDFPFNVPIASQLPHAVGVAYAMKLRQEPRVALAMCGDGATSKGDFYEAINAAGAWNLPLVVVVVNNQYAISVPRRMQSAAQTLAQKAIAAGIACEQLDGNDLIAVRDAVGGAVEKARAGGGPTLLEALTYRLTTRRAIAPPRSSRRSGRKSRSCAFAAGCTPRAPGRRPTSRRSRATRRRTCRRWCRRTSIRRRRDPNRCSTTSMRACRTNTCGRPSS